MEASRLSRLRWRRRGAWMWPAFAVLTPVSGVVVHLLPFAAERVSLVGALLLAAFFNLVIVAVLAPLTGVLLRRRRGDLPRVVATDRAGTALLGAVALTLLGAGLAHRPAIESARDDFARQAAAVRSYVRSQAPAVYRAHLSGADTIRLGERLYRTCVPGADPDRALCLFVSTDQSPPGVRVDPNRETNASFGPGQRY